MRRTVFAVALVAAAFLCAPQAAADHKTAVNRSPEVGETLTTSSVCRSPNFVDRLIDLIRDGQTRMATDAYQQAIMFHACIRVGAPVKYLQLLRAFDWPGHGGAVRGEHWEVEIPPGSRAYVLIVVQEVGA